jgi:flavin reductase (DIM6/NTAB) family NADH-FMN oxidoreductase RutF
MVRELGVRTHEAMQNLSQALAKVVGGAYVLTLRDESGAAHAIVLSFVQQVGFDPPRLVLSIFKERDILGPLDRAGAFVLNIVADGEQALLRRFSDAPREAGRVLAELGATVQGGGYVLPQAAAHLSCKLVHRVDISDHWLYIVDVSEGAAVEGRAPLVHTRRSGLRY